VKQTAAVLPSAAQLTAGKGAESAAPGSAWRRCCPSESSAADTRKGAPSRLLLDLHGALWLSSRAGANDRREQAWVEGLCGGFNFEPQPSNWRTDIL